MMLLGWTERLYILAFDQRGSLLRGLFGVDGDPSLAQTRSAVAAKGVIFAGVLAASGRDLAVQQHIGVLIDEQLGGAEATNARRHGLRLAIAVERSSQAVLEFEYGEAFAAHIERFDPDFAKVLVRYNPRGDAGANRLQRKRLLTLSDWVHEHDRKLLFELLVPAEPDQLAAVGDNLDRYDTELRPTLMLEAMIEMQEAGIEADLWKIEGLDARADAQALARQARTGAGRHDVGCLILGRGASAAKVRHWLEQAAPVTGFVGFAIGRSIWWDTVKQYLFDGLPREVAVDRIASAFLEFIDVYETATASGRD